MTVVSFAQNNLVHDKIDDIISPTTLNCTPNFRNLLQLRFRNLLQLRFRIFIKSIISYFASF